jgi:hypothetical protein
LVGDHVKIDHPLDFVDVIEMEFPGMVVLMSCIVLYILGEAWVVWGWLVRNARNPEYKRLPGAEH